MLLLPRLIRAKLFIEHHYQEPIRVEHIARAAFLSPFHFIRAFKHRFGATPHNYVRRKRIEKACDLLASSGDSVSEIAWKVGFESVSSFTTIFRKITGESPTEYRNRIMQRQAAIHAEPKRYIPNCFLMRAELLQLTPTEKS